MARRHHHKRKLTAQNRRFSAAAHKCQARLKHDFSFKKLGSCMRSALKK